MFNASVMLTDCEQVMRDVCADFGAQLREFNGEPNHVHLLVHYPPTVTLSRLVNSLKGVSSRRLHAEYLGQVNRAGTRGHLWLPSYLAASCGRAPLEIVKEYIRGRQPRDQEGLPARPEGWGFRPR